MCALGELLFTPVIKNKMEHIRKSAQAVSADGLVVEFGVAEGKSLTEIADTLRPRLVYGLDSFEGLPETWVRSPEHRLDKGHFRRERPIAPPRENTRIIVGMIEATFPALLKEEPGPLAFMHIDVDLGSVAAAILREAGDRIVPGTVIRFDEFCDWGGYDTRYHEWPKHEYRALMEWMEASGRKVRPLSRDSFEGATFMVQ